MNRKTHLACNFSCFFLRKWRTSQGHNHEQSRAP